MEKYVLRSCDFKGNFIQKFSEKTSESLKPENIQLRNKTVSETEMWHAICLPITINAS